MRPNEGSGRRSSPASTEVARRIAGRCLAVIEPLLRDEERGEAYREFLQVIRSELDIRSLTMVRRAAFFLLAAAGLAYAFVKLPVTDSPPKQKLGTTKARLAVIQALYDEEDR